MENIEAVSIRPKIKVQATKDEPLWYIHLGDTTFKLTYSQLITKALESKEAVTNAAIQNGYKAFETLERSCIGCTYNKANPFTSMQEEMHDDAQKCAYTTKIGTRIARPFAEEGTGRVFMAVQEPCAYYDAMTRTLADAGALDEFINHEPFAFEPIVKFTNKQVKARDHEIQKPNIWARIKEYVTR